MGTLPDPPPRGSSVVGAATPVPPPALWLAFVVRVGHNGVLRSCKSQLLSSTGRTRLGVTSQGPVLSSSTEARLHSWPMASTASGDITGLREAYSDARYPANS